MKIFISIHHRLIYLCIFFSLISQLTYAAGAIGLAKKAEITNIVAGANRIQITYHIANTGTDILTQINLSDDYRIVFGQMATLSNFSITTSSPSPASDVSLPVNAAYNGQGNLIQNGMMIPGTTATVILTFDVKLTDKFGDNTIIQNNANIESWDESSNPVDDGSNDGDTPIPGTATPTVIPLTQIVIEAVGNTGMNKTSTPPSTTVNETDGTMTYNIRRKGYLSQTSRVNLNLAQLTATLGTSAATNVDAWKNPLNETLTFGFGETSKQLTINLVNDDMYEPNETFDIQLLTPATQYTNKEYNNVSILIPQVRVTIASEDPMPVVNISSNSSLQVMEGTGTGTTTITVNVTLSGTSSQTITAPWFIPSPGTSFTGATSGNVIFAAGEKAKTITLTITRDNIREPDEKFKVQLNAPTNAKLGNPSHIEFKIIDDDLRQIQWINNTPKSLSGRLDAGSGITDTIDIHFLVLEAPLNNPTVQVKLPASITYVSYLNTIDDANTIAITGTPTVSGTTWTFKPNTTSMLQNQKVHFRVIRRAECAATTGAKNDEIRVVADGDATGVEEMTDPSKIGTGARVKYANYNVYLGKLSMTWKEGEGLQFDKTEMGAAKKQALSILNTGQGRISSFDFYVKFTSAIGTLQNAKIRGTTRTLTFTGPTVASGFDTYKVTLSGTDYAFIGNKNNVLDNGEEVVLEYDFKSATTAKCGIKSETVWVDWGCLKPAATLNTTISLYEPQGKPVLERTLISPATIMENGTKGTFTSGTPNIFVLKLANTGKADAHYTMIPLNVYGENEWFNANEVLVSITNTPTPSFTRSTSVQNVKAVVIQNLMIPAGETATITLPVRRHPLMRYTPTTDMLALGYFCYVRCGDITYSDECQDPLKKGTIGYTYFNTFNSAGANIGSTNISHLPDLMTTDIARIDISNDPTANRRNIAFELGTINTIFPFRDAQNWFGGAGSSVVVTVNLTPNISLAAANLVLGANTSPLTITPSGNTYTITIPYNATNISYFAKNGKLEMTLQGECSGGSTLNPINYTVDFITNQNVRHGLYRKSFDVLVKCNVDPGANLKHFSAKRINYVKGDGNNNGIFDNAADGAKNPATMRLDRLYHNDTIMFEYIVRIGQHNTYDPGCTTLSVEPWNILYATISNINPASLQHVNSAYWIYDQNDALIEDSVVLTTPDLKNPSPGKYFFLIDRSLQGHKFNQKDSIIVRSRWVTTTLNSGQWERSDQLLFWTYCEMTPRAENLVFTPRIDPCDLLSQNYEKEFANISFYSLSPATNGAARYKNTFVDLYVPQNATYDHHLSVGYQGYNNLNFPNELRQPYYVDNMQFQIPYGFRVTGGVQYFGYPSRPDLVYARYPAYTGLPTPAMQGMLQNVSLTAQWDINIFDNTVAGAQVADEGWVVLPYIPIDVTPKANSGENIVTFKLDYKSPTNIDPFSIGSSSNAILTEPGFIIYNNAASFVLSCGAPETVAFNDTVRWPIRITNNSSAKDVKDGWIYIDGPDMELVKLIDKKTNTEVIGKLGFEGKWLKVADVFPRETFRDYYLVARYTKYHCTDDDLKVWPWHNYAEIAGTTPLTLFGAAPLDTADFHVGRSVDLQVINQQSEISGVITPLEDTPINPAAPASGLFNKDEVALGQKFPVEITLSSNDIIAVKDVGMTLYIPQGLHYVHGSAHYEWKGLNQVFKPAGEIIMQDIDGSGTPVFIPWKQINTEDTSRIAGTYHTQPNEREVKLRFELLPECTGISADSIILSAQVYGTRLCGDPAIGHNNTTSGRQIYIEGHRYYQMRNDMFTPDGNVFALCDNARASRTIQVSFTRIGAGELQDDKFELEIPVHFDLNGADPIKYIDPGIDPVPNPIVVSNTVNNGKRIIQWSLPVDYVNQFTNNVTVEYSVDLKLDVDAPNLPDKDTIVANIVVDHVQCIGDPNLLATDTMNVYIYTAKIGLAKAVTKAPPTADGFIPVTYTYTITNYSNTTLVGLQLSDNLIGMFNNLVEFKNQFNITTSSAELVEDPTYQGMGNLLQSGEIAANTTQTVTLQIWVKPTYAYDGRIFENNAYIRTANLVGCEANDSSTVGLVPAFPDLDPYRNEVPTPVWFNVIRFKHNPPEFRIPESYGDLVLTIERIGQDFSPAEVDVKLENESVQLSGTEAAKLGTSNTYPTDAWWQESSLTKTLGFGQDEKEKTVTIHIVDDKIFELTETFLAILANQRYLSSSDILSLINDTLDVYISNNDQIPTLNISAVADSVLEGPIPPTPLNGCTDMNFRFKLTNPTYLPVTASWQTTTGGTGVPGVDFTPQATIQFTIPAEDSIFIAKVCIIADDIPEPSRTVEMQMVGFPTNARQPSNMNDRKAMAIIVDDDLVITLVKLKHLTCKNDASGQLIVKVAGGEIGTGAYAYAWTGPNGYTAANDTITGLQAGLYTVTVTDKWGSFKTASYQVNEPTAPLAITVDQVQNATCYSVNNGSINTTITGGWDIPSQTLGWTKVSSPYTANTDDINNLNAGVYVITVSDSARCVVADSIEITEPKPIEIADTVIRFVTCMGASDGSISITPEGGNSPYFIHWSGTKGFTANNATTITGLVADTYTVTIGDTQGCPMARSSFEVKEPATQLSAFIDTLANVACKNDASGRAVIKAEGGWGQYVYTWSDGVVSTSNTRSDLRAMDYSVVVSDSAGCRISVSPVSIIEPATRMEVTIAATDETYQNGNDGTITVTVAGGVPAYIYSWDDAPALNTNARKFLEAGSYSVTVTDQWNCVMKESAVITEPNTLLNLPNVFTPDGDGFNDKLLEGYNIKVFDRWGLLLYEGKDGWDGRYKGKMMTAGTYFYVLVDEASGKEYKSTVLLQNLK